MSDDSETILQEILNNEMDEAEPGSGSRLIFTGSPIPQPSISEVGENKKEREPESHSQWAVGGNNRFMPVGATKEALPAGIYEPFANPGMWGLELVSMASDTIYQLPDMATEIVLTEVKKFWASEELYRKHNLLYKRGILLFGPPGSGKTIAVKLLMQELVRQGGIVMLVQNVNLASMCLKAIRRIEPKRNLIVVLEDIDEIIQYNGESAMLSMLDGENNVDNVLNIGTTNYPEKLGARIINRPSRFDRRLHVGMPSAPARQAYLEQATHNGLSAERLAKWTEDTNGMSIAHLRELIAAVYCLEQSYEDTLERLVEMAKTVKIDDGFKQKKVGW